MNFVELIQKLYFVKTIIVSHENTLEDQERTLKMKLLDNDLEVGVIKISRNNYDLFLKNFEKLIKNLHKVPYLKEEIDLQVENLISLNSQRKLSNEISMDGRSELVYKYHKKNVESLLTNLKLLYLENCDAEEFVINETIMRFLKGFTYSIFKYNKIQEDLRKKNLQQKGLEDLKKRRQIFNLLRNTAFESKETKDKKRKISVSSMTQNPELSTSRKYTSQESIEVITNEGECKNKIEDLVEVTFNDKVLHINVKQCCFDAITYFLFLLKH